MNLSKLSDEIIVSRLNILIVRERKLLHLILLYLAEFEKRKLYLTLGRSTLFEYLVKDVGYSGGSSQRRIEALRLMLQAPELAEKIESGAVNLTQVGLLSQAVKQKEEETKTKISAKEKSELLCQIENKSSAQTQKILCQELDIALKAPEKKQVQKDESVHHSVTFTKAQDEKLLRCQELLGHKLSQENKSHNTVNTLESLMDFFLDKKSPTKPMASRDTNAETTRKNEPAVNDLKSNLAKSSDSDRSPISTRSGIPTKSPISSKVPTKTRRAVFQKYSCCQFQGSKSEEICGSRYKLEIEHLHPLWAGGSHDFENLTVLCSSHNKFKYQQQRSLL
jgi:hypothetical protein